MGADQVTGQLYGVGVGPGDPELMTLKAHRLISNAKVIAYPAPDHGQSMARTIAASAVSPGTIEIPMIVPMQSDRFPAQTVYQEAAAQIADHLDAACDVVVLCEGDPFFYGSFMYLFSRLATRYPTQIVPGVSSLGASAAALRRPLVARNDTLTVLPGTLPDCQLQQRIETAETVAILKVGRHLARLRALIGSMGLNEHAGYIERATMPVERVAPLTEAPETAPYFSMIVITKGDDPWLRPS